MSTANLKKHRSGMKAAWDDHLMNIIAYGFTGLLMFICAYPLYYTVIASFSDPAALHAGKITFWPVDFTVEAYELAFQNSTIWRGYRNSIAFTVLGTLLNLFLTLPAAFAMSRKRMFGRKVVTVIFLISMYFGGGLIPFYLLIDSLGLIDTFWVIVIIGGVSLYNVIVTRTFMENNIPEELYESARIDGASEFRIFIQMTLPLSGAIIAVMTLYYATGRWGQWFDSMIYTLDDDLISLQLALRRILILNQSAFDTIAKMDNQNAEALALALRRKEVAATMRYSVVFIASAPMLILYPFVQKHFVKGVMVGSIKG